jgi:hypothetical protein
MNTYLWMSRYRSIHGAFSLTDICSKNIKAVLPDGLFGLETRNEFGSPVKKGDPLFEINGKNPIADTFHYGATRSRKAECGLAG